MFNADVQQYLDAQNNNRTFKRRLKTFLPLLAILVIFVVFWWLKLTGITMAGEAFCGHDEHEHSAECAVSCEMEEHIHTSSCYSDISADIETSEMWEATLDTIPEGLTVDEQVMMIAISQLDYKESELNFVVDDNDEKQGYTRYGEWYGNPYGEWSTMFTSFCLNYAGLDDLPLSSGAETMLVEWQEAGLYKEAGEYVPCCGDVVFIDKDADGDADATAIVTEVTGASIEVVEGDLNNMVAENGYELSDKSIVGYGVYREEAAADVEPVQNEEPEETEVAVESGDEAVEDVDEAVVEQQQAFAASRAAARTRVATTTNYNAGSLYDNNWFILYAQGSNNTYYAIDGNGSAVQIFIEDGKIYTDSTNVDTLFWDFVRTGSDNNRDLFVIQNKATGMYLHPYYNNNNDRGNIHSTGYESFVVQNNTGFKVNGRNQDDAYLRLENGNFTQGNNQNAGSVIYLGAAVKTCTIWLDGTNGNLRSLSGSPDQSYSVGYGSTFTLPTDWQSPAKYDFELQGWYDVKNSVYYEPGDTVTVTDDMVFYADWQASSYDVGFYNQQVADTVSTNDFITTHVFDYNYLFNVQSLSAKVDANANDHTETWTLVRSGTVPYNDMETLDFAFRDYHSFNNISNVDNRDAANDYDTTNPVITGIYNQRLGNLLFGTDNEVIGKKYVGTGDHLFQINTDPTSENYGYYYYDCALNAASYNQTDQRFYVYEYLERTEDSAGFETGTYSDIVPFNSPYANNNGQTVNTYEYDGQENEYVDTTHYQYEIKEQLNQYAGANMAFGMSINIDFYMPNSPGFIDENGEYGNKDIYGNDMHFKFSGDDDLWVLLDGEVILDIGGIHTEQKGDINFSTGQVTVNGQVQRTIEHIKPGEHTLTILYLERGSSMSNCAFYFNLAPRYALELEKEDVLTKEKLNGAEFSVYTDRECTIPAELWESQADHDNDVPATNTFTVENGKINMWGFGAGNTYYIKETKAPDAEGYHQAKGIIRITLDKTGISSHSLEMIKEVDADGKEIPITNGYTVHGFRIDEADQKAYVVVTNAQDWVKETTTVQVMKKWNDNEDHTYDAITAYLTVTDPDGTVRRIREITLSEENNWRYIWSGLPKHYEDGTPVKYGAEEAYEEGYSPSVERLEIDVSGYAWAEAGGLNNNTKYYLWTEQGFLAAVSSSSNALMWMDEEEARNNPLAEWTVTNYQSSQNSTNLVLTNGESQMLSFNFDQTNGSYFSAERSPTYKNLGVTPVTGGYQFYFEFGQAQYMSPQISDGKLFEHQKAGEKQTFVLKQLVTSDVVQGEDDFSYRVTNTPLDEETSLTVTKAWDVGMAKDASYERAQVTIKLLANGVDTGRTVTLSLKNNWTDTFRGLPYKDNEGNVIQYTVVESWDNDDWLPEYGEIEIAHKNGDIPTYETTVTNSYKWGHGYELPATGGTAGPLLLLSALTMLGALICGYILRRKREGGYG